MGEVLGAVVGMICVLGLLAYVARLSMALVWKWMILLENDHERF